MPRVYAIIGFFILLGINGGIEYTKTRGKEVLHIRTELAIAITVIGTVVGAGFASGQELVQFFLTLGSKAFASITLTGILLCVALCMVRLTAIKAQSASYHDLLSLMLGKWKKPADVAIGLFLFGGLVIMLAGAGAVVRQYFNILPFYGIVVCASLSFVACLGRGRGLLVINSFMVPFILIMMILIAVMYHSKPINTGFSITTKGLVSSSWVLNAFLYVVYNMVNVTVLLTSLPGKQGVPGAVFGGMLISLLIYYLVKALSYLNNEGLRAELPLLYLLLTSYPKLIGFYALALLLAMMTTAASDLYGLTARLEHVLLLKQWGVAIIILLLAVTAASCGFTNLVVYIYPLFGYLGLLLLLLSIVYCFMKIIARQDFL